jgi:hypothetical protein
MPLLKRKRVLAAKIEGTIGTAEVLSAADAAFNIYDPMIQATIAMQQREGQGGFGMLSSMTEGHIGVATFRTYLEWDGTATEPSWADTFFPACGWVKTGQTYFPIAETPGANVKTLTIGLYHSDDSGNTVFKSIAGAMGAFVVTLPTGKPGYIDWTFTGVWQAPTAPAMITPTYPTDKGLKFSGGLAEWNDVNLCVSNATINSGNEVIMRECPTTEAGYISALVTNRVPTISADPEAVSIAAQNRWANWLASTDLALELDVGGPTNSQLEFNAPKAQIINNQEADRSRMVTDAIEFQCNKNGATHDQELQITFTAAS